MFTFYEWIEFGFDLVMILLAAGFCLAFIIALVVISHG